MGKGFRNGNQRGASKRILRKEGTSRWELLLQTASAHHIEKRWRAWLFNRCRTSLLFKSTAGVIDTLAASESLLRRFTFERGQCELQARRPHSQEVSMAANSISIMRWLLTKTALPTPWLKSRRSEQAINCLCFDHGKPF